MSSTKNYDLDIDTNLGGSNASDYIIPSQKAIKTYVDNNAGGLPSQTGHSGDLLTTDGTDASWADTAEVYPVIEIYKNGDSWYRIYAADSTGYRWCEQGGYSVTVGTIQFLKAFNHTPYVTFGGYTSTLSYISSSGSATQMTVAGGGYFCWKASGYIPNEQGV